MYRYSRAEEASSLIAETEALLGTWDDDFDGASVKDAADRTLAKVHGAYVGPVRCLPIEILSRCFHFLAAADPPVYTTYTGEDASQPTEIALGWIKVRIERYISGSAFCIMTQCPSFMIGHPRMSFLEARCHWEPYSLAKFLVFRDETHLF